MATQQQQEPRPTLTLEQLIKAAAITRIPATGIAKRNLTHIMRDLRLDSIERALEVAAALAAQMMELMQGGSIFVVDRDGQQLRINLEDLD